MEKEEALFLLKRLRRQWEEDREHYARLYKQFKNERAKLKEQYAIRTLAALELAITMLEPEKEEEDEELSNRDVSRFFGR